MEAIGGFFGRLLLLPYHAVAYTFNTDNWDNTFSDIAVDALGALKEVVDGQSRSCFRVYVKMCEFSQDMGVSVKLAKPGVVALSLLRSGNFGKMKREELDKLERECPTMVLNYTGARMDIDVSAIQKCFRTENAAVEEISRRIAANLKALSEAIDIYRIHGDGMLVYNIARVLYHSEGYWKPLVLSIKNVEGMVIIVANKGVLE